MTLRLRRLVRLVLVAAGVFLCAAGVADAQATVTAPELKAAFIYNFAKFSEWPESVSGGSLTICVAGDPAIANALNETANGRTVGSRVVAVSRVNADEFAACQILYLTGVDLLEWRQTIDRLKGAPILTVSDAEGFAQGGGIIGLYLDSGKMRFAINLDAAQRARVRISSRLLSLATVVRDFGGRP